MCQTGKAWVVGVDLLEGKLPEEPLKPGLPSLPPSSQKPPTCFPTPVQGWSGKIFEPVHILILCQTIVQFQPWSSWYFRPLKCWESLQAHCCTQSLTGSPSPLTSLKGKSCFWKGRESIIGRDVEMSETLNERPRWQYQMQLGCKQPGCYQGIGAADSPRPSPNLSTPASSSKTTSTIWIGRKTGFYSSIFSSSKCYLGDFVVVVGVFAMPNPYQSDIIFFLKIIFNIF